MLSSIIGGSCERTDEPSSLTDVKSGESYDSEPAQIDGEADFRVMHEKELADEADRLQTESIREFARYPSVHLPAYVSSKIVHGAVARGLCSAFGEASWSPWHTLSAFADLTRLSKVGEENGIKNYVTNVLAGVAVDAAFYSSTLMVAIFNWVTDQLEHYCSAEGFNSLSEWVRTIIWPETGTSMASECFVKVCEHQVEFSAALGFMGGTLVNVLLDYFRNGGRDEWSWRTSIANSSITTALTVLLSTVLARFNTGGVATLLCVLAIGATTSYVASLNAHAQASGRSVAGQIYDAVVEFPHFFVTMFTGPDSNGPPLQYKLREGEVTSDSICCPISGNPMHDPVVLNGRYYDRGSIQAWIRLKGTDPVVRCRVSEEQVRPCPRMKRIVRQFATLRQWRVVPYEP